MSKKLRKRIIKNIVRVKFEIPITCKTCGGKIPAKRVWLPFEDEDFDDDNIIEIKVEPCPACEEEKQEKLNRIGAIMDAFNLLLDESKALQDNVAKAEAGAGSNVKPELGRIVSRKLPDGDIKDRNVRDGDQDFR